MSLPSEVNPHLLASSSGYQISRSVRFRLSATAYLNRTPVAGNLTTWTWSGWVKRGNLANYQRVISTTSGASQFYFRFNSDNVFAAENAGTTFMVTTQVFRDPSAWYHIVFVWDTTNATAGDRARLYVNGSRVTAFSTMTNPSSNATTSWNSATAHYICGAATSENLDCYLTEVNFIDGQALTPTSFGAFDAVTGVWNPIRYSGTYGNNGFYLNFSDNSAATAAAIGKDSSGNGNNWTPTNISVTTGVTYDSMVDSPTNYGSDTGAGGTVRGNYATLNPLANGTAAYVKDGNLRINPSDGNFQPSLSTIGVSSGKWYAECTVTNAGTGFMVGIDKLPSTLVATNYLGNSSTSYGYYGDGTNARLYNNSSYTSYGATYTTGAVIGVALDMDAGTLVFYRNGVSQGTAATGLSGTYVIGASPAGAAGIADMNFGQRPFANTAPSGYKALCTQNLPTVSISNPNKHFDILTTTATNSTGMTLSGLQFQPDFFWRKNRNNVEAHYLFDRVRGATSFLSSNTTGAEAGYPSGDGSVTFNSDGYTIADSNWNNGEFYFNGRTYVDWFWKAGGTAVTNTNGTISSQVSANPTAGFSVLTYTGTGATATIGHGLGGAPSMMIMKKRSAVGSWKVFHTILGNGKILELNATDGAQTSSTYWNDTSANSTVFTVGTNADINASSETYVAYCWSQITGYSAFGSYIGNGSTDGPFVYCGFRPRFVLMKISSSATHWIIIDSSRDPYNVVSSRQSPNLALSDTTLSDPTCDFLSNGFKVRTTTATSNQSGDTYIYAAFAENPFTIARAR